MNFRQGIVIGVANNFVEVKIKEQIYACLIKGSLKFQSIKILVGDYVKINFEDEKNPLVISILPRINELYRPRIANVDQVLIVSSLVNPLLSSF